MTGETKQRPMTIGEVATAYGVNVKAVRLWADQGLVPCWRTPKGHRRFDRAWVEAHARPVLDEETE